jgi:endonuclease YncB( thermonuclease family)
MIFLMPPRDGILARHSGQVTKVSAASLAIALLLLASATMGATAADRAGLARVIDGDTIELSGQRIRLWGIDAPERAQTCQGRNGDVYECGRDSAAVLRELMGGRRVECSERDRDRYGRVVAVCRTEAGEINAAMAGAAGPSITRNTAPADTGPRKPRPNARRAGRFELPWEWRQRR